MISPGVAAMRVKKFAQNACTMLLATCSRERRKALNHQNLADLGRYPRALALVLRPEQGGD